MCRTFRAFFAVFFVWTANAAAEKWMPNIWSYYCEARSVLVVHIAPPKTGASDYYVAAMRKENGQRVFVEESECVQKTDTEVIYEVKGFPTEKSANYIILVRAIDVDGMFLSSYLTNKTNITIPPVSASNRATISAGDAAPTTGKAHDDSPGFHIEVWIIVVCVVLFLLIVFIVVMLKVGGCRTSSIRRLSVRSRTSQGSQTTTASDTLVRSSDTSNGRYAQVPEAQLPMMHSGRAPPSRCISAESEDSVFA